MGTFQPRLAEYPSQLLQGYLSYKQLLRVPYRAIRSAHTAKLKTEKFQDEAESWCVSSSRRRGERRAPRGPLRSASPAPAARLATWVQKKIAAEQRPRLPGGFRLGAPRQWCGAGGPPPGQLGTGWPRRGEGGARGAPGRVVRTPLHRGHRGSPRPGSGGRPRGHVPLQARGCSPRPPSRPGARGHVAVPPPASLQPARAPLTLSRGASGQPHGDAAAAQRAGPPAAPVSPPPRSRPRRTAGPRWRRSAGRGATAADAEGTDKARRAAAPLLIAPGVSSWRRTSSNQPRSVPSGRPPREGAGRGGGCQPGSRRGVGAAGG